MKVTNPQQQQDADEIRNGQQMREKHHELLEKKLTHAVATANDAHTLHAKPASKPCMTNAVFLDFDDESALMTIVEATSNSTSRFVLSSQFDKSNLNDLQFSSPSVLVFPTAQMNVFSPVGRIIFSPSSSRNLLNLRTVEFESCVTDAPSNVCSDSSMRTIPLRRSESISYLNTAG